MTCGCHSYVQSLDGHPLRGHPNARGPFSLEPRIKLPPGTRIRTPSGRFARVESVDTEGRVHATYYDGDADERDDKVCFPAKLLHKSDVIPAPNTHIPREKDAHGKPLVSEAPEYTFYRQDRPWDFRP